MSLSPASHLLTSNHVPINCSAQSNTDAEKSLKRGHLFTDFQLQITSTSNHSAQSDPEAEKSVKRGHFSPTFHFKSHPRQITQLIQILKQKSQWKGANFHRFSTSSHIHVKSLSSIRHWSRKVRSLKWIRNLFHRDVECGRNSPSTLWKTGHGFMNALLWWDLWYMFIGYTWGNDHKNRRKDVIGYVDCCNSVTTIHYSIALPSNMGWALAG